MQIVAVTDPLQVGFHRQAMIGLGSTATVRGRRRDCAKSTRSTTSSITAGSFDILLELVCEDDEHLLRVRQRADPVDPGVRATETFVYLRLAKQTYAWGTR